MVRNRGTASAAGAAGNRLPPRPFVPALRTGNTEFAMSIGTVLLIVLILLLLGAVPAWPYSRGWGYYPSGLVGLLLLVVIVLMLAGAFTNAAVQ